jgi:hypothetical protein
VPNQELKTQKPHKNKTKAKPMVTKPKAKSLQIQIVAIFVMSDCQIHTNTDWIKALPLITEHLTDLITFTEIITSLKSILLAHIFGSLICSTL